MFFIRPESLDPSIPWEEMTSIKLQEVTDDMRALNSLYPVGGVILFGHNINDEAQLESFVSDIKKLKGSPLLAVDEEGGRVARIARNSNFNVPKIGSMASVAEKGDPQEAYNAGFTIGSYLKKYGFDVDFAPVADVNTNPDNIVIGDRAFSDDPETAAPLVANYVKGLKDSGIIATLKHFPGHGDTHADTHFGYAATNKSWEEMLNCEMIPFKAGIDAGAMLIMTAHIAAPEVTGSDLPSTLSPVILQEKLRGELGYQGIIIADAMEMGAITNQFSNTEAALKAIEAGVDILLCPKDFIEAFEAVVDAVQTGRIPESRIDESVERILALKKSLEK